MGAITLQFVGGDDMLSRTIEWFSAGQLSHVDAVLPRGRLLGARLLGPHGRGVQIRPPGYEPFARRIVVTVPASAQQAATFHAWLRQQIGKPYDWRAIAGFFIARDWREEDSWFCSELIARGLEIAGVFRWPLYLPVSKITPVTLAVTLSAAVPITTEVIAA